MALGGIMAGTDRTRSDSTPSLGGPAVVLVDPQLGENIGMVARAMLNCGLTDLRLVRPRDGWPSAPAEAAASGASKVLAAARLFPTTEAAVADLRRLYAASGRPRGMVKRVITPRAAVADMRRAALHGEAVGVLFGPERSGLVNDDIALADGVIEAPLNPAFCSLNLAQAVLIVGYEWFQAAAAPPARRLDLGEGAPAAKAEIVNFYRRLEAALDETGFLFPPEKRPRMVRNLRNLFGRAELSEAEVKTLHGIVTALRGGRRREED